MHHEHARTHVLVYFRKYLVLPNLSEKAGCNFQFSNTRQEKPAKTEEVRRETVSRLAYRHTTQEKILSKDRVLWVKRYGKSEENTSK